jgi:hypothetical protein
MLPDRNEIDSFSAWIQIKEVSVIFVNRQLGTSKMSSRIFVKHFWAS